MSEDGMFGAEFSFSRKRKTSTDEESFASSSKQRKQSEAAINESSFITVDGSTCSYKAKGSSRDFNGPTGYKYIFDGPVMVEETVSHMPSVLESSIRSRSGSSEDIANEQASNSTNDDSIESHSLRYSGSLSIKQQYGLSAEPVLTEHRKETHTSQKQHTFEALSDEDCEEVRRLDASKHEKDEDRAIRKEFVTLVDYMDPNPVLKLFLADENAGRVSSIRDIQECAKTSQRNRGLLEFVSKRDLLYYSKFKKYLNKTGQRQLVKLLEMAERKEDTTCIKKEIKETFKNTNNDQKMTKDLQTNLISHYRANELNIPVSPLVEHHSVPLVDFYVTPQMLSHPKAISFAFSAHSKQNQVDPAKTIADKASVDSYHGLFINRNNQHYRNIYVSAPAGMGKTSFSQSLAITWCQAHSPDNSTDIFEKVNLETMRHFDLLFLIHLRDYRGFDTCLLDDIIVDMLDKHMAIRDKYPIQVIQKLLEDRHCFVVLDGLDEWMHPSKCPRKPAIPHNNHFKNCTVLSTTRPWKLSTIGLAPNNIDQYVEICQLDEKSSTMLEINAVNILNKEYALSTPKSRDDFDKAVSSVDIGEIRHIPYIKLQLICLWYDGEQIGNSRCELFSNVIELTLKRGLEKIGTDIVPAKMTTFIETTAVPKCMETTDFCRKYKQLLYKVGKLAFFSLFNDENESTLIIDSNTVSKYLVENDIEFCVKVGLLSQIKDSRRAAEVSVKVLFQNKSVQEFFAAFYISMTWSDSDRLSVTRKTIQNVCKSVYEILEMSNLFIFVCGLSPDVYSDISREFQNVIAQDKITSDYRMQMIKDDSKNTMLSYQTMQVACYKENVKNKNDICQLYLQDIFLGDRYHSGKREDDTVKLKEILQSSMCELKTVYITYLFPTVATSEFFRSTSTRLSLYHNLETLRVNIVKVHIETILDILKVCVDTLKYLYLGDPELPSSDTELKHETVCFLLRIITSGTQLENLILSYMPCLEHSENCPDASFNLSQQKQLLRLHLRKILLSKLDITQNSQLVELCLWDMPICDLNISNNNNLQQLFLFEIPLIGIDISNNSQLEHLHLERIALSHLDLSNNAQVQKLYLERVNVIELDLSKNSRLQQLEIEKLPLRKLDLTKNYMLQYLDLDDISISKLELSQNIHLEQLNIKQSPLTEIHLNTEHLRVCKILNDFSPNVLSHGNLQQLVRSVGNGKQLSTLHLNRIQCFVHIDECPGVPLVFSSDGKLEQLRLKNIAISELNLSQQCRLRHLEIETVPVSELDLSHNTQLQRLYLKDIPVFNIKLNAYNLDAIS